MIRKLLVLLGLLAYAAPAAAQLDPLLFVKDTQPYVLLAVDVSNRMQFDAAGAYYDPYVYAKTSAGWETTLGISASNTTTNYRRKYVGLNYVGASATASAIQIVTDKNNFIDTSTSPTTTGTSTYSSLNYAFSAPTRLALARAAMYQAIIMNQDDVQFGLLRMRQNSPTAATQGNTTPISDSSPLQETVTENGLLTWKLSRPTVSGNNGSANSSTAVLIQADSDTSNEDLQTLLAKDVRSGGLLPTGNDTAAQVDAPINNLLLDAKTEATRLIKADTDCTNTVVVLITGGGDGNTVAGVTGTTAGTTATGFLSVQSGRRVPIYVIALAPSAADRANLQAIAANSGGQYTEITAAQINAALASTLYPWPTAGTISVPQPDGSTKVINVPSGTVVVPEFVTALNTAVQHGLADPGDVDAITTTTALTNSINSTPSQPFGRFSDFQVTSPVIGTADLDNAKDIAGTSLPNTVVNDRVGNLIPQRSNLMVTTAFSLPGFYASMRAFRQYKPVADNTQPSGYKFQSDGTRLWTACAPGATPTGKSPCLSTDSTKRNLYTATASGTIIPFNTTDPTNLAVLAGLMNLSVADATTVINFVRSQPLGAIVDSTPAIMNPPSLDPPPDDDYPGFSTNNQNRRGIIWVGTNAGILEALDSRLGVEVWGFIPLNLLPKLKVLRLGQGLTTFHYFVDGSPKIADVKIPGSCDSGHPSDCWHTHLIMGEGPGGVFYQSFDVTLPHMSDTVPPDTDDLNTVLSYFSDASRITINWEFPKYTDFDATANVFDPDSNMTEQYGDLLSSASAAEKAMGQTWSDPAIGQVQDTTGPYSVLIGSGFLPYSMQQQTNRGGQIAGTTFYVLSAKDGTLYSSMDVGNDGQNENIDDCSSNEIPSGGHHHLGKKKKLFGCNKLKNALQSDPVATGPADSRFITKAYMGDLDGRVWRFDIGLDTSTLLPKVTALTKLYESGQDQPIFSSMATVNVGGTNQYIFFGTGSDLLPSTDVSTKYHLLGVLDNGTSGTKTLDQSLAKTNNKGKDEKVTAFPAVAGDIVFFTTTLGYPANACKSQDANLYAFTFTGGAAYDTNGDNKFTNKDSTLVTSIVGERATAPFIVDQHLVFGTADKVAVFGDSTDYNNGIGQAGVRILSWREVR